MGKEPGFYPAGQVKKGKAEDEPVSPVEKEKVEVKGVDRRQKRGLGKEDGDKAKKAKKTSESGAESDQRKGEKALPREDKREYHQAVNEERQREEDGRRRESGVTGGASGSNSSPEEEAEPEETEEETKEDEEHAKASLAKGLGQPREPSAAEVATHRLSHLPHEEWCPVCVSSKGQERPFQRQR